MKQTILYTTMTCWLGTVALAIGADELGQFCWRLQDGAGTNLIDTIKWTPDMSAYIWSADGLYQFEGQAQLFSSPSMGEMAVFSPMNKTNFFGGHYQVTLFVIWLKGRAHTGTWSIFTDDGFKTRGTIEPMTCEQSSTLNK